MQKKLTVLLHIWKRWLAARRSRLAAGFTVLFSMLIATLIIAIGLAIFDIVFKEISFATAVRDSNYAIYAADTGLECALYWDRKCDAAGVCPLGTNSAFATSTASDLPTSGVMCNGWDITQDNGDGPWQIVQGPTSATTDFTIYLNHPTKNPPYCAQVTVTKDDATGTLILTRGYNTCDVNNPNRIERTYANF